MWANEKNYSYREKLWEIQTKYELINPYCLADDWFLRFIARRFWELEKNCQMHEVNLMIITEMV